MAYVFKNDSVQSNENNLIAIENFQRVYDQMHFYRSELRPVVIQFFMWLQNEQQIGTTNQNSVKTCEKPLLKP